MMKFSPPEGTEESLVRSAPVGRRGLVAGVGVAGVAALAATAFFRRGVEAPLVSQAKPARDAGESYRETEHVLRYYESARG